MSNDSTAAGETAGQKQQIDARESNARHYLGRAPLSAEGETLFDRARNHIARGASRRNRRARAVAKSAAYKQRLIARCTEARGLVLVQIPERLARIAKHDADFVAARSFARIAPVIDLLVGPTEADKKTAEIAADLAAAYSAHEAAITRLVALAVIRVAS